MEISKYIFNFKNNKTSIKEIRKLYLLFRIIKLSWCNYRIFDEYTINLFHSKYENFYVSFYLEKVYYSRVEFFYRIYYIFSIVTIYWVILWKFFLRCKSNRKPDCQQLLDKYFASIVKMKQSPHPNRAHQSRQLHTTWSIRDNMRLRARALERKWESKIDKEKKKERENVHIAK